MSLPSLLRRGRAFRAEPVFPDTVSFSFGALPLAVRRNPRAKRLILRLAPGGEGVCVTAPPSASPRSVLAFLARHEGWVRERLGRTVPLLDVRPGARLPFRGGTLDLVHAPSSRASRFEPLAAGKGAAFALHVGGDLAHFPRRVRDALKREARADLLDAVSRHAGVLGLRPASVSLKDTKSRWGSCSTDRRLAFSWRIVMAPPAVLDYLAAHEVAHFRHMDHGRAFWALCRELCPGMDAARDWLRRHGGALHAIRFE